MKALFSLFIALPIIFLFSGYSDIVWSGGGYWQDYSNNSPREVVDRYPYTIVQYDTNDYMEVRNNEAVDTTYIMNGTPHELHYYNGWWFDYTTGIGFPARME